MDKMQGLTKAISTEGPVLLRATQSIRVKKDSVPPDESLINPDQLRCIGIKVNDVPHCHGGLQSMTIPVEDGPDIIIPFTYSEGNHVVLNEMPSDEDKNNLPIYDITGPEGWDPRERPTAHFDQSLYDEALPQRRNTVSARMDPVIKERWMEHLCISDENQLHKTLAATTQLAAIEPSHSLQTLRQHEKRRLFATKMRRIQDILGMDTFSANCKSVRGFRYVLILAFKRGRLVKAYPMKAKTDTLECFRQFLTDIGIPEKLMSDGAGEFVQEDEFLQELRQYKIKQHVSGPHHQHQNHMADG